MDREKIIDGLRHCVPETIIDGCCDCGTCPYQYDCETNETVSLPIQMVEDIRSLLKEQEAKEQEVIESINFGDRTDIMANLEGLTWDDWRMYHSDTEVQNIAKSAFYLLITLLKEQEPMKVKTDMYGNAYCPWCSTDRTIEMGVMRLHLGTKFCPYCGKAVKWNDIN